MHPLFYQPMKPLPNLFESVPVRRFLHRPTFYHPRTERHLMFGASTIEFFIIFMFSLGGQLGVPLGLPPGPEDPMMARFAPAECVFYSSWASTTTPDPSRNVTEAWMAQPELQASYKKLRKALQQVAMQGEPAEQEFTNVAFKLVDRCVANSVGFYISKLDFESDGFNVEGGALITLGDDAASFEKEFTSATAAMFAVEEMEVTRIDVGGQTFHTFKTDAGSGELEFTWGVVDKYLAVTVGAGEMQRLMTNMKSDVPEWLTDLRNELAVERVSGVSFIDAGSILGNVRKLAEEEGAGRDVEVFEVLGLNNIQSAGWVCGLDDHGFVCRGSLHVDGQPEGILGLFGSEQVETGWFGKVANDRMIVAGASLSATRIVELIREINDLNEYSRGELDEGFKMLNEMIGIDIENDVIRKLDDRAILYGSVNFANPMAGWVFGVGASNEMELTDTYAAINKFIKKSCEDSGDYEFEESEINGTSIFSMSDNSEWGFMPDVSWALGDGALLLSLDKSSLRRHLRRESMADDSMASDEWFGHSFDPPHMDTEGPLVITSVNLNTLLQIGLPMLSVFGDQFFPDSDEFDFSFDDIPSVAVLTRNMKPNLSSLYRTPRGFEMVQRQTFPGGTPGSAIGMLGVGMLPASMAAQKAAARVQSANNIRQLVLAMHNYHDVHRGMPARFSKDAEDKPLLSWRVHILPYLEGQDLYDQFHLDEPWDSEHNRTLIEEMPDLFKHPRLSLEAGKTVYVAPVGDKTVMSSPEDSVADTDYPLGMKLENITDGTSRTGVIFEANADNAVTWTQPADYEWRDKADFAEGLIDAWPGDGVNVALADGSVQFITREKLREIFKELVIVDDGEIVEWDN